MALELGASVAACGMRGSGASLRGARGKTTASNTLRKQVSHLHSPWPVVLSYTHVDGCPQVGQLLDGWRGGGAAASALKVLLQRGQSHVALYPAMCRVVLSVPACTASGAHSILLSRRLWEAVAAR